MNPWQNFRRRAAEPLRRIALADGADDRAVQAAVYAVREGMAAPLLLGPALPIEEAWKRHGGKGPAPLCDPRSLPPGDVERYTNMLLGLPKFKACAPAEARRRLEDPLVLGNAMLRAGDADGLLGGATRTTTDTLRAVLSITGVSPRVGSLFGFFLLSPRPSHAQAPSCVMLADCAVMPEPSAKQLAGVGVHAAQAYRFFTGNEPRVAFLSFSTAGSARHAKADFVREAVRLAREKAPDLPIEGEWQADAALDPFSAGIKGVGSSPMAGKANVLIVPDLNTGNIAYKLAQRLGGIRAVGPVLWGAARPANDLSRGCSAEDIIDLMALTALQAHAQEGVRA